MAKEKKPKKPIYKRVWFWVLIIFIFIIAVGSCNSGSKEPKKVDTSQSETSTSSTKVDSAASATSTSAATSTEAPTETPTEAPTEDATTEFTLGDTADFDGVQVKLSAAILSNGDGEYITPDDGKYFLGLIFDISNDSSSDIAVSSMASFEAYCDEYSISQDLTGYQAPEWDGLDQLDGSVAAGKKMNGVIVFQVPQDFQNFEITYAPDFWGSQEVTFKVPASAVDTSSIQG
ncbi:MAG: DUF4352 domain-containing protein [Lachnospiraceae bacterium]|nr:DUF4352 domain-containing protein [Lachnospiraceae bacterium]